MTVPKLGAAVHRALLECETVEEVAEVFAAVKDSGALNGAAVVKAGEENISAMRDWGLWPAPTMIFESPPCRFFAMPVAAYHFEALARRGATDTRSMMFRLLRLARRERSRIEKIPFHSRRVKDDIRRHHAEILKEARAFHSFPDYRRLP